MNPPGSNAWLLRASSAPPGSWWEPELFCHGLDNPSLLFPSLAPDKREAESRFALLLTRGDE